MGWRLGWRDERECACWPPHPNPLPRGAMPAPYPTSLPILIFHSPLFILQLPTLLIKLTLAIVQLPAAIFKLATAVVILSAPIVAHFTLPAVVARIFIISPTVRVISVVNRLLNIANGVIDNIGLGRYGGQREQGEKKRAWSGVS